MLGNSPTRLRRHKRMRRLLLLVALAIVAASCGDGKAVVTTVPTTPPTTSTTMPPTGDDQLALLAAARQQWASSAPADYTLTEHAGCEGCVPEVVTLAVREGEVVSLAPGAELATVDSDETWAQWKLDWDATEGDHLLQVRATDKNGFTQSPIEVNPAPNGAEGYDRARVRVT